MSATITGPRHTRPVTRATLHAPGPILGPDRDDPFDEALPAEPSGRATRRRAAFWLLAFVFAAAMLGTTLPTPLYVIYQAQWHFSAATVTVIFAVYAVAVLATLLVAGRSSDQAGRRPVLAVALGLSAFFVACYGGLIIPVVGVGVLSGITGTFAAVLAFSVLLAALCMFSLVRMAR
jgi:MFS family permease